MTSSLGASQVWLQFWWGCGLRAPYLFSVLSILVIGLPLLRGLRHQPAVPVHFTVSDNSF